MNDRERIAELYKVDRMKTREINVLTVENRTQASLIVDLKKAFVRLAIPTTAILMDKPSHKYIAPEIISEWRAAHQDGNALVLALESSPTDSGANGKTNAQNSPLPAKGDAE